VTVETGAGGFAYVPGEVITTEPERARELAGDLFPGVELGVERLELLRGRFSRLIGVPDVPRLVRYLRASGVAAQPNHVFFAHCDDPCCGRPHPAARGGGGAAANPVYASPVYASPVYASPVYASPVYASPVYASDFLATGIRKSSARPVSDEDAADVAASLAAIAAPTGGGDPDVVVLDTGLARSPDYRPAALGGLGALVVAGAGPDDGRDEPDASPLDELLDPAAGHGTFIAGLVELVAPGARIELRRVIHPQGDGDEWTIAGVIDGLPPRSGPNDRGAVLNLSFGGHVLEDAPLMAAAIAGAQARGYTVVASAGNDGVCRPTYPAAFPGVVSVGAIGPDGPAPFTNFGPWLRACAPGVDLISTFFTGWSGGMGAIDPHDPDPDDFAGWARWSGTSFSAPVVAGALAHHALTYGVTFAEAVARVVDDPSLLRLADLGTVVNVV
jgi:hypothetical protein